MSEAPDLLRQLGVSVIHATTDASAAKAIAAVIHDAEATGDPVAIDTETMPHANERERLRELLKRRTDLNGQRKADKKLRKPPATFAELNAESRLLAAEIRHVARAGLDPRRASVRLVQVYGGGRTVAVIDLAEVCPKVLAPLWRHPLVAHNAAFDLSFLTALVDDPIDIQCTLQATRLFTGTGTESLATACENFLGITIAKELQTSDWSASQLSQEQLAYAALDPVVTFHLARKLLPGLDRTRSAYEIQVGTIPAVVGMEARGFAFDRTAHAALITALRAEQKAARKAYIDACDDAWRCDLVLAGVPETPADKRRLLETLLTSEELLTWTRTDKQGALSTKKAELRRAVHYPPIAALVKLAVTEKQLSAFGPTLAFRISPAGRIHAHYNVAGANTGRATCSGPNLQQIPRDKRFRALFVSPPGRVLIAADYNSMELRAAAYISGDLAMTAVFERGDDMHRLAAARMTGQRPEDVSDDDRQHAKPVNFGAIYGMGSRGLIKNAWDSYNTLLTDAEAKAWLTMFADSYPGFAAWRREHAQQCENRREITIGKNAKDGYGRIYNLAWLKKEQSSYTRACNLPIQGACADASMLALTKIDAALFEAGFSDADGPVAWLHDEIVIEVPEADAEEAGHLLVAAMIDAFAETFPGAPLSGLVEAHIGLNWADAKEKRAASEAPMQEAKHDYDF